MQMFTGSMPALVTPMRNSGDIDWEALAGLIEWHIQEGTDALVAMGTTGESATMNHTEHGAVIGFVVDRVNKRIPVIAGTGSNCTDEAIAMSQDAHKRGADALLQVVPYYNRPSQEGLVQHFSAIAQAVDLPQLLYNVPTRTGLDMATETALRLAEIGNIVGIKEAGGDAERWQSYGARADFAFISGEDANNLSMMRSGACGVISVTANVAPKLMCQFCRAANSGDWDLAESLHEQLLPLHAAIFCEPSPAPAKWALNYMGAVQDELRLPLVPLAEEANKAKMRSVLAQLGIEANQLKR